MRDNHSPTDEITGPHPVSVLRAHRWTDLPSAAGVYWWYFPEETRERFHIPTFCSMSRLHLQRAQDGKLCLYHGMATSLVQRIAWHAEQHLTLDTLRSGFLSTLRFTLLALNDFDYRMGRQEIDRFMDSLSLAWLPARSREEAKAMEASELQGEFHYPLNIQHNSSGELTKYLHFLKNTRKAYKERYLKRLVTS
jgi:hypothetical protein